MIIRSAITPKVPQIIAESAAMQKVLCITAESKIANDHARKCCQKHQDLICARGTRPAGGGGVQGGVIPPADTCGGVLSFYQRYVKTAFMRVKCAQHNAAKNV
eukprot:12409398-Karenia_brevis.AAC.1